MSAENPPLRHEVQTGIVEKQPVHQEEQKGHVPLYGMILDKLKKWWNTYSSSKIDTSKRLLLSKTPHIAAGLITAVATERMLPSLTAQESPESEIATLSLEAQEIITNRIDHESYPREFAVADAMSNFSAAFNKLKAEYAVPVDQETSVSLDLSTTSLYKNGPVEDLTTFEGRKKALLETLCRELATQNFIPKIDGEDGMDIETYPNLNIYLTEEGELFGFEIRYTLKEKIPLLDETGAQTDSTNLGFSTDYYLSYDSRLQRVIQFQQSHGAVSISKNQNIRLASMHQLRTLGSITSYNTNNEITQQAVPLRSHTIVEAEQTSDFINQRILQTGHMLEHAEEIFYSSDYSQLPSVSDEAPISTIESKLRTVNPELRKHGPDNGTSNIAILKAFNSLGA